MPQVTFLPYNLSIEVARGTSVLAAADEVAETVPDDFFIGELCEGRHECGNCCIEVVQGVENLSPMTGSERRLLAELKVGPAVRSSCTARVQGDVTVRILTPVKHGPASGKDLMQGHP